MLRSMIALITRAVLAGAMVATTHAPSTATADPILDRAYSIELYEGVAIGDTVLTGMGGAGCARIVGSAGSLLNPAASAVRQTTDNDSWSWDYHLDLLTGKYSSDYDNNGTVTGEGSGAQLATLGLALRFGSWAGALTAVVQATPIAGAARELTATTSRVKLSLAHYFAEYDLAIGAGLQVVQFSILPADQQELFGMTGTSTVGGLTWLPRNTDYRVAVAVESRVLGNTVSTEQCDPLNCEGFILPEEIESPGRVIAGLAYRWGPTRWNQQVPTKFRDERAVTLTTDLVITGSSTRGNGLEAFGMQELQAAGRSVTVSPRGGVEFEAFPGRLRVRAGSYWEPARFVDVKGRVHGTFGLELRALEFRLWGLRRGRLSATFDIASNYRNIGASIGFWQ